MPMVVGIFESLANAQDAVADLLASGYSRNAIKVLVRDDEPRSELGDHEASQLVRPANTASRTMQSRRPPSRRLFVDEPNAMAEQSVMTTLETAGLKPAAARFFADAICNGAVLVAVHCAAPRAWDARDILDVYNDSRDGPRRHTLM